MSPTSSTARSRRDTPAFDLFVGEGKATDPAALIAYAIYKSLKREWVIDECEARGQPLTHDEASRYRSMLTAQLEQNIKKAADDVLRVFGAEAVKKETPEIMRRAVDELGSKLPRPLFNSSYKEGVAAGVTAALFWSILLIVIGIIVSIMSVDVFEGIEKLHHIVHPS